MHRKSVLLVGNGINRPFDGQSWNEIIKDIAVQHGKTRMEIKKILTLPASMQVIAATNNSVSTQMQMLAGALLGQEIGPDHRALCEKVLAVPVEHILTANYTFELEQAAGIPASRQRYYALRQYAFPQASKDKSSRLHVWNQLPNGKKVWHIHGDVTKPDSVIMGHHYYGRLVGMAWEVAAKLMRFPKEARSFRQSSWVDLFLTRDVYIVGFGMYLSEIDLWWLVGYKRLHFPDTRIYFYTSGEMDPQRQLMLESYGVELIVWPLVDHNYVGFYERALAEISDRVMREENAI